VAVAQLGLSPSSAKLEAAVQPGEPCPFQQHSQKKGDGKATVQAESHLLSTDCSSVPLCTQELDPEKLAASYFN